MKAIDPETHYPIVSLHRQMFVWSALLLVTTVWMFWADYDREWKKIQRDFIGKEHEKADAARKAASAKTSPEMADLETQLAAAEGALKAKQDEINSLKKEIDAQEALRYRKNGEFLDADQHVKSTKYFWDEAEHELQELQREKKAIDRGKADATKAHYEEWVKTQGDLKVEVEKAQAAKDAASAKLKAIEQPVLDLREKIDGLALQIAKLEKRYKDTDNDSFANRVRRMPFVEMLNPDIKIKQVQIDSLVDDYYFAPVPHVDRCMTCHLAIDRKGYDGPDDKNPLRTHPRLDLYLAADSKHPIEQFGCTGCHSGSGRSCTFTTASHTPPAFEEKEKVEARWKKDYDWEEMHHWDDPQLPKDLLTASCWKCHKQETELEGADGWNAGRKVFDRAGCFACHRTQGFETARKPGPSLYHVADKITREWAYQWVLNPQAVRPETRMPRFFGTNPVKEDVRDHAEAQALVDYIFEASEPLGDAEPPIAEAKADSENGKKLAGTVGCLACHSFERRPKESATYNADLMSAEQKAKSPGLSYQTTFGPDLAGVGSKVTYAWLWHWVKDPKHYFPETRMPNLRLTDGEAADIAAYLKTLTTELPMPEEKAKEERAAAEMELHHAAWEYLRAKHSLAEVGEDPKELQKKQKMEERVPPPSYAETLAQDFFSAQLMGATAAGDVALAGRVKGTAVDKLHGRLSLMGAAGVWKDAGGKFDEIVTGPLGEDLKDDETMRKLAPALARAKQILTEWSGKLVKAELPEREKLYLGDRMVNRYGCFSCHNLRGFELTTPIGRDFTGQDGIGGKDIVQIDFGFTLKDDLLHKDRWEWLDLKIHDPRIFDRGYEKHGDERLRMPYFPLSDTERQKLIVFLASLVKTEVPVGMQKRLNEREAALERGGALVRERNCAACHRFTLDTLAVVHEDDETHKRTPTTLEGLVNEYDPGKKTITFLVWKPNDVFGYKSGDVYSPDELAAGTQVRHGYGGDIVDVLLPKVKEAEGLEEAAARVKVRDISPPILVGEGKKVRPEWLFGFLKQPVTLRGFLEIRMPTFGLSDDEATDIVRWFSTRDSERFPYESVDPAPPVNSAEATAGKAMFESKTLDCVSCHVITGKKDSGGTTKAPDLNYAKDRLKVSWMLEWLKDPAALQPGTRMPKFKWGKDLFENPSDGDEQMRDIVDYLRRLEAQ